LADLFLQHQSDEGEFGKRIFKECYLEFDLTYFCENICRVIPAPMWPDPDKEPLPPPLIHSILKRPPNRPERAKITKFTIMTPADPEQPDNFGNATGNNRWVL
jgi:hypothetical protein